MKHAAVKAALVLIASATLAAQDPVPASQPPATPYDASVDVQRFALVVGAEDYEQLPHVPNALNDAYEAARALQGAGFKNIRLVRNPKRGEIEDYVDELAKTAGASNEPAIIVFFYAGHGFQNSTFNYLSPVDARTGDDVFQDSVPVINVMRALATHRAGLSIFLLDACRTALEPSVTVTTALPTGPIGFASIAAPRNAVIGLATQFNATARSAARQGDANSPYTQALIRYIPRPAMSLDDALDRVRALVQQLTNNEQTPEELKSGSGNAFYFAPTDRERDTDATVWHAALATNRRECVDLFVRTHPGSVFLKSALLWLDQTAQPAAAAADECPAQ